MILDNAVSVPASQESCERCDGVSARFHSLIALSQRDKLVTALKQNAAVVALDSTNNVDLAP